MIRIDASKLETVINKSWIARAKVSTEFNRSKSKFVDKGPSWSDIKTQYIDLQGSKCAYCEKPLVEEDLGAIDMEHYRPKSSVRAWPTRKIRKKQDIQYSIPKYSSKKKGYYLLTHNLWNYVASCKKCNSLKSDFFPTMGRLDLKNDNPLQKNSEEPFLLFPLGDHDLDPEDLFRFDGVLPVLVCSDKHEKMRARVTIDFFNLANRNSLIEQRAGVIDHLWTALFVAQAQEASQSERAMAYESVCKAVHYSAPHSSCARSFRELYLANRDRAKQIYERAHDIHTKSFRRR